MKVDEVSAGFVIVQGDQFFSFLVDHDRSCWTKRGGMAIFDTRENAEDALDELRRRNNSRRKERAIRRSMLCRIKG